MENWKSPNEAAFELGVSRPTVKLWASEGRLRYAISPTGRWKIDPKSIDELRAEFAANPRSTLALSASAG